MLRAPALGLVAACALTLAAAGGPPPTKPAPSVFGLVQTGDLDGLRTALASDPSLADVDGPSGMTPLGAALSKKNEGALLALLEAGANPNKPFGPGLMRPLQGAAARGLVNAVDALLAKGADPNGKDVNGGTALHEAANNGLVDLASKLSGKGADVNARYTGGPNTGATPVHLAAKSKNMLMIIVLGAHQPNWNLTWNGRTAAQLADDAGAKDVADYIRARQDGKR